MRLLLLILGLGLSSALLDCAQSESVSSGGAAGFTGLGGDGGPVDGAGGVPSGGTGSALGGAGGSTGGAGGTGALDGGGAGGTGATGTTGGTGGTGASGGSGTGGTGACTPPVPGGKCDTFPQCGCAAGLACNVYDPATGTTQCVAAGTIAAYAACTNLTDCMAGHACVGGACKAYCDADPDCAKTGGACIQVTYDDQGVSKPVPGMKVCTKKCKLENPSMDCGPTLGCYLDTSVNPPRTDCAKAGTAMGPGTCSTTNTTVCAPGYVCLTNNECAKWCRVGYTTDCSGGKKCVGFSAPNQIFVNTIEYGVCQ
jgi:hypothetical protein